MCDRDALLNATLSSIDTKTVPVHWVGRLVIRGSVAGAVGLLWYMYCTLRIGSALGKPAQAKRDVAVVFLTSRVSQSEIPIPIQHTNPLMYKKQMQPAQRVSKFLSCFPLVQRAYSCLAD